MQDAFDGYRLCETKKGYSAMNGITAGDDRPFSLGPIGAESYHPTRLGYQLLEDKILSATNNLSSQMPSPDTSADLPSETGLEILNAPKSGRPINAINYDDDVANDVQYRGGARNITYKSGKFLFKPASKVKVYLKSDPVFLGEFDTDQSGNVDIEVNASVDIPTGFHTLHIYGTNIVGQPVDIQKVIYVNDKPTTEAYAEPEETEATAVPANIESNTPASPQNTGSDNSASQSGQKLANASSLQNAAPNAASSAADNHGKVLGLATSKSLKQATNKENVTLSSFNLLSKNWPVTSTLLSITAVALIFILWRRTLAV
jgi:hypothetical protein